MLELYPEIKLVHVTAVIASGTLFLLRGAAVNWGGSWGMIAPIRYLSYTIDIVLLTAAVLLLAIVPSVVYSNGWLWLKLTLLVIYIVFGMLALAIAIYSCMYVIARTHDPLGPIKFLLAD
jgi:uncharacterized membrane protein SirB2